MTRSCVIVFAKAPQPGRAKTRLQPALGPRGAAELARRMLLRTLEHALRAQAGPVDLCASPAIDDEAWTGICLPTGIDTSSQGVGDLGQRMARAASRQLANGFSPLLCGTDCIEMSPELLAAAARSLARHDAVIHPTADGGYALLGLKRYHASLFADIPWSSANVATITIERMRMLGWHCDVRTTVHDVDLPEDLAMLPAELR